MKVHILGAGWAVPRGNRSKTAILIQDNQEDNKILFDCGGDVAKGVSRFDVGYDKIDAVFISHKHLDHLSGLSSLLHSTWLMGREKEIPIYSNKPTKKTISKLISLHDLNEKLDINLNSLSGDGIVNEWGVEYKKMDHQVETHGFRYKDITFSGDTKPCDNLIDLAQNSSLLLQEATYPSGFREEAWKYGHCTVRDAKDVFEKTQSNNLGIIHTSPKVDIDEEGKKVDEDVFFPSDFTTYKL
ncbi:hypothetical protein C9439_02425 [archaeon SCG-AAA382B04]|nr:hypothetical protein C9439_02425 [archaeon SCG-AAA382B04]